MASKTPKKKPKENLFRRYFSQVNKAAFWTTLLISIALIVTAFFIPPQAVVDGSVVACVGELFGFAALGTVIEGIEKGRSVRISKGDTTMSLNDNDGSPDDI